MNRLNRVWSNLGQKIGIAKQFHKRDLFQCDRQTFELLCLEAAANFRETIALLDVWKQLVKEAHKRGLKRCPLSPAPAFLHHRTQALEKVSERLTFTLPVNVVQRQEREAADVIVIRCVLVPAVWARKCNEAGSNLRKVLLRQNAVFAPVDLQAWAALNSKLAVGLKVLNAFIVSAHLFRQTPPPEAHGPNVQGHNKMTCEPPTEEP